VSHLYPQGPKKDPLYQNYTLAEPSQQAGGSQADSVPEAALQRVNIPRLFVFLGPHSVRALKLWYNLLD
jgi:hypothetical protein